MRPKIIHSVNILLYKRTETQTDPEFGVTGLITWAEPVTLKGQVRYEKYESFAAVGAGNDPINIGHAVFYAEDWQRFGGSIGDELEIENSSRLIITEIRPAAHYHGKFYHVHVYFTRDRTQ